MKNFLFTLFILFFSTTALAVQCPDASHFTHEKGSEWKLSDKAKLEGWNYTVPGPKNSDLKTLPSNTPITIILNILNHTAVTECSYGDYGMISFNNAKFPDVYHAPQPPFVCYGTACTCKEDVKHTDTCVWKLL